MLLCCMLQVVPAVEIGALQESIVLWSPSSAVVVLTCIHPLWSEISIAFRPTDLFLFPLSDYEESHSRAISISPMADLLRRPWISAIDNKHPLECLPNHIMARVAIKVGQSNDIMCIMVGHVNHLYLVLLANPGCMIHPSLCFGSFGANFSAPQEGMHL